jgi:hypothetical protein
LNAFAVKVVILAGFAALLVCGCDRGAKTTATPPPAVLPAFDPTFVEPEPLTGGYGIFLRLDPKPDAKVENRLRGEIEVATVPDKLSIPVEATGKSALSMDYTITVARKDATSVELSFNSTPLKLDGKVQGQWEGLGGQKGNVRFDRRSALLEDPESLFEGLFGAGMIAFPENPIAPGSTWSSQSSRNMPPFGEVRIAETFTYRGIKERNGVKVHQIDSSATGTIEDMKVNATESITEDGLPYEAEMTSIATAPIGADAQKRPIWARFTVKVDIGPKR